MAVSLVTDYHVGSGNIILTLTIGEGQVAGSLVRLGEKELAIGDVTRVKIGLGKSVKGKTLFVKSVVTAIDHKTDRTNVRYELRGGKVDRAFDLDGVAEEEGGSATYRVTFNLKS